MIFSCCGPEEGTDCQDSFVPVLTERGICYAYNPTPINDFFFESSYTDIFKSVFDIDLGKRLSQFKVGGTGQLHQMHVTLDSHLRKGYDTKGDFVLSINQNEDFMSVVDSGITIKPGFHTLIKMKPSKIDTTMRFEKIPQSDRDCRFRDEHSNRNASLFK